MNREEILRITTNILTVLTHDEDIKEETTLKDDLNMDSLDEIEVVIMIEKEFNIHIPDADMEDNIKNISDLVNIIEKLLAAKRH